MVTGVVELANARELRTIAVYGGTNIDKQIETISRGIDIVIATLGALISWSER